MPARLIDITGKRYGHYTVVSRIVGRKQYWNCRCDCGTERPVFSPDLRRGASTSCGCIPPTPEEIAARSAKASETKILRNQNKKKREANRLAKEEIRLQKEKAAADLAAAAAADQKVRATDPAMKKVAPGFKVTPGKVERYGMPIDPNTPMIALELMCYRENAVLLARGAKVQSPEYHFRKAFALFWPKYEMSEWVDMLIHAWCNYKWIFVIGHQRASKSFTMAHICWLDYCADPQNTLTSMGTITLQGLRIRMWSDMQRAAETAAIKFPIDIRTSTNELRAFPPEFSKESAEKFQIMGMALNNSKDAEGKIRGGHAPRRRLFLDEAENISPPIYEAMVNPMSAPDAKAAILSNPMLKISKFGQLCMPIGGWSRVTDADLFWIPEKFPNDGIVIHFDGRQSPNVKAGHRKYTGLLIREDIDEVVRIHGMNSLQYWSLIVGFPPPDGIVANIWPSGSIEKGSRSIVFDYKPVPVLSLDPAFEHDASVVTVGEMGMLKDGRMAINATETIVMQYDLGPNADIKDYQCAHQLMAIGKRLGVDPKNVIVDRSGGGRGVYGILQKEWSRDIQGIEYGGAATERSLRSGGDMKANETVEKYVSELWFRSRFYAEDGLLGGLSNLDPKTVEDLGGRIYTTKEITTGTVMVAEKKTDFKARLGRSCDWGDSFCGFGELLARLGERPGGAAKPAESRNDWRREREAALKASSIYSEAGEFSH